MKMYIGFQVVNIERPKTPRNQIQQGGSNDVPEPPSEEMGEWGPPLLRQHGTKNNIVVPRRLRRK